MPQSRWWLSKSLLVKSGRWTRLVNEGTWLMYNQMASYHLNYSQGALYMDCVGWLNITLCQRYFLYSNGKFASFFSKILWWPVSCFNTCRRKSSRDKENKGYPKTLPPSTASGAWANCIGIHSDHLFGHIQMELCHTGSGITLYLYLPVDYVVN